MANTIGSKSVDIVMPGSVVSSPKKASARTGAQTELSAENSAKRKENFGGKTQDSAKTPSAFSSDVEVFLSGKEEVALEALSDKKELEKDEVETMTEALNDFMAQLNCNIEFKYHEKLGQLGVQMIDKDTKEIIKEFPPEEILKAMEKTKEWIGVFLDRRI